MQFEFTPAAERALTCAAGWTSSDDCAGLLLGLLAEPECRAALILAAYGIDHRAVSQRFPDLSPTTSLSVAGHFPSQWRAVCEAAERLLIEYPRPLVLATEHLLLGIAASPSDVGRWLTERGLLLAKLEAEVHRLSGHQPGPLPIEVPSDTQLEVAVEEYADDLDHAGLSLDEHTLMPPSEHESLDARGMIDVLRIIDAAANRAGEGLRVIEDYLRFVLDDRHLTGHAKSLRHDLAAALAGVSSLERHAARETRADVGTDISLPAEQARGDARAVAAASFKRVEQSLRSLEEYAKTLSPQAAAALEQLRYRSYTLERAADLTANGLARLADAQLYVLLDARESLDAFRALVAGLVSAGVAVIQLRDKQLPDRQLIAWARLLRELTAGTRTLFIMNDRPDLAVLAGADGVHVGQDELSVKDARRIVGPHALIGVSTHSIEQARAAVLDGASYIGVGPTFPSGTKHFAAFTGVDLLTAVHAEIRLPAFAIGGVTLENLPQVLATGITRVAVSGAITAADDPADAALGIRTALDADLLRDPVNGPQEE